MPSPLTVEVVEGTEQHGPVLYEIRHLRDGRTWKVHRRYSTLHAMTEALRAEKVKLPSVPFPPKRWQLPVIRSPCTPVMPPNELEDRRDGLQSYLSALSDLSDSWNSPTVTDVLCEEEAVAATPVDDSGASEAPKTSAESITIVPEATTQAVVDVAQAEMDDADGTVQPVVETLEKSSTPEAATPTETDESSAVQEPGQNPAASLSAPLAQIPTEEEEEEEVPTSWPEPFVDTPQFANPTPHAPVDDELPEAETPVADMLVADSPEVAAPVGDAAMAVAVAEESSADASVDDVSASTVAREATDNVAESLSTYAPKSDSNDPTSTSESATEPERPASEVEPAAEPLEEATTASLVETSAESAESTSAVATAEASAAVVDVQQELPASHDAGVDVVFDVAIASEAPASTQEVADEVSALQNDSPEAHDVSVAAPAADDVSVAAPAAADISVAAPAADDVSVAAPAADTAVMAPASGSNIMDADANDRNTEESTIERQQPAMTNSEDYRVRAEASAASRGSDASVPLTSSVTLTSRTSSSNDDVNSTIAGNGAAGAASPVAEEAAAPASKRTSLLSRAKRSLKKSVEEVSSSPSSPAVANSKAPRLSGGSGRLSAIRDKARSVKDRLSHGGTAPLLSSKGKGKSFFSLSSTTSNNTNAEGGVGSEAASPGQRSAEVENPPCAAATSPLSQPSLTMEGGGDSGLGEVKGSKGGGSTGGDDPFPSAGERGGSDPADNSIPPPPSPGGE